MKPAKKPVKPVTPRGRVKAAIRQLWLRSRERAAALKRDKYTCQKCGVKQSKAKGKEIKVEVHHKGLEIEWETIVDYIIAEVLRTPEALQTLCPGCHKNIHEKK